MREFEKAEGDLPANDSSLAPKLYGRPRTRLFTFLSAFWIMVSLPAMFIAFHDVGRWTKPATWSGKLKAIGFEQWVGIALILMHMVFVILAVRYRLNEQPREEIFPPDDPDDDANSHY